MSVVLAASSVKLDKPNRKNASQRTVHSRRVAKMFEGVKHFFRKKEPGAKLLPKAQRTAFRTRTKFHANLAPSD